jgi:hypothetical protein
MDNSIVERERGASPIKERAREINVQPNFGTGKKS